MGMVLIIKESAKQHRKKEISSNSTQVENRSRCAKTEKMRHDMGHPIFFRSLTRGEGDRGKLDKRRGERGQESQHKRLQEILLPIKNFVEYFSFVVCEGGGRERENTACLRGM